MSNTPVSTGSPTKAFKPGKQYLKAHRDLRHLAYADIIVCEDGHGISGFIPQDIVPVLLAAPELLEVCKRMRRKINDYVSIDDVDALDAVIAKAEGRS